MRGVETRWTDRCRKLSRPTTGNGETKAPDRLEEKKGL
jgi:hypothetical protein